MPCRVPHRAQPVLHCAGGLRTLDAPPNSETLRPAWWSGDQTVAKRREGSGELQSGLREGKCVPGVSIWWRRGRFHSPEQGLQWPGLQGPDKGISSMLVILPASHLALEPTRHQRVSPPTSWSVSSHTAPCPPHCSLTEQWSEHTGLCITEVGVP